MLIEWKAGKGLTGRWAIMPVPGTDPFLRIDHEAGEVLWVWGVGSLGRRKVRLGLEDTEEDLSTLRFCMKPSSWHV